MKSIFLTLGCRRLLGRGLAIWLLAFAVAALLPTNPAHAQPRPPTIPNTNGSVTIHSIVGGPNAISITLGGTQPGQFQPGQSWSPAPMTFGPALSPPPSSTPPSSGVPSMTTQPMTFVPALPPPPQQPTRVFYVYYRDDPALPWICFGGYRTESHAQQSVYWFRQSGRAAFCR